MSNESKPRYFLVSYKGGDSVGHVTFSTPSGGFFSNKDFQSVVKCKERVAIVGIFEFASKDDYDAFSDGESEEGGE